jgi:hypothetical protein
MSLRRQILREFGFGEHESPRVLVDIVLGAIGAFAALLLIAFIFENKPSPELRRNAVISATLLPVVILLAKNRLGVVVGIVVVIGVRGLVAALIYGYWPALGLAALAGLIFYFGARWYGNRAG